MEDRFCQGCDALLVRRKHKSGHQERMSNFKKRITCGHMCRAKHNTKKITERFCLHCGDILKRKTKENGKFEESCNFKSRTYCDHACAWEGRRKIKNISSSKTESYLKELSLKSHEAEEKSWEHNVTGAVQVDKESLPHDAQFKNELGIFKKVGGRLFRHDNYGWVYKPTMNDMKFSKDDCVKGKGL